MTKIRPNDAPTINVPTREVTTTQQLTSLLNVAGFMLAALHGPPKFHNPFNEDAPTPRMEPTTREGIIAAETCFIKTCEAIEKIVEDPSRWSSAFQTKIETDYENAMKMNLEYIKAQRDMAVEMATPHYALRDRVQLGRMPDGSHVAFIGDPGRLQDGVFGVGSSPREALEAFDEAFRGVIAKSTQEWAEKAAKPEPPKRRRIYPKPSKKDDGNTNKTNE